MSALNRITVYRNFPANCAHPLDLATRLEPVFATLELWQTRARQRRQLASLSDHMLRDIGISHADAHAEASKPFWRG
ncbi:MAG: DUF1127 domain-containing protein [Pseudomonadota bacterium]